MHGSDDIDHERYVRQTTFAPFGQAGQQALAAASVLIVGVGGLGSWVAELLARAGVGRLRLVDDDRVDPTNLHRQAMYTEADLAAARPKAEAAAAHLAQINAATTVEVRLERVTAANLPALAEGMDLILDGTDNFPTRFVINDYCVRESIPWVFGGAVGDEGQVMAVVPPQPPCLRCLYETPPDADEHLTAARVGVLNPIVATVAAIEADRAVQILTGRRDAVRGRLLRIDLWNSACRQMDVSAAAGHDCPCCRGRRFPYLEDAAS